MPRRLLSQLSNVSTSFFGKEEEGRGGVRVAWEKVCLPKNEGGLRLKRVKDWNRASIMKLESVYTSGFLVGCLGPAL